MANTLAYDDTATTTVVKSFIVRGPGPKRPSRLTYLFLANLIFTVISNGHIPEGITTYLTTHGEEKVPSIDIKIIFVTDAEAK